MRRHPQAFERPADGAEIGIDAELGTQDPGDGPVAVSPAVQVKDDVL